MLLSTEHLAINDDDNIVSNTDEQDIALASMRKQHNHAQIANTVYTFRCCKLGFYHHKILLTLPVFLNLQA